MEWNGMKWNETAWARSELRVHVHVCVRVCVCVVISKQLCIRAYIEICGAWCSKVAPPFSHPPLPRPCPRIASKWKRKMLPISIKNNGQKAKPKWVQLPSLLPPFHPPTRAMAMALVNGQWNGSNTIKAIIDQKRNKTHTKTQREREGNRKKEKPKLNQITKRTKQSAQKSMAFHTQRETRGGGGVRKNFILREINEMLLLSGKHLK